MKSMRLNCQFQIFCGKSKSRCLRSVARSGGERGADVETLRGTHGPEFEADAIINRAGAVGCGCSGGKDMKERLILIKGPFIFVYANESDKAPKYAISLANMKAKSQGASGGMHVVSLETGLGDVEYEVSFKTQGIATEFATVVKKQAAVGEAEQVRKVCPFICCSSGQYRYNCETRRF